MTGGDHSNERMRRIRRRASRLAGEGVALGWATSERLAEGIVGAVRRGRRLVRDPSALRARRLRRLNAHPLANLWEVHPEARLANARELGLRSVPLDEIAGTAVAGPAQRGGDFLPLPRFRSSNWRGRWARIRAAVERLEVLPPVDLVKYAGRYWVTDGHNRVAAALYAGQVEIDAVVSALVAPGATLDDVPATLAELAPDSFAVRAAGSGRWTRGASRGAMDEASAFIDRAPKVGGGPPRIGEEPVEAPPSPADPASPPDAASPADAAVSADAPAQADPPADPVPPADAAAPADPPADPVPPADSTPT